MYWWLMLEESFSREVLKIGVLDPALDNSLVGQAMEMLKIHQSSKQPRRCRLPTGS